MENKTENLLLKKLKVTPIDLRSAKQLCIENHYMRTAPQGARIAYGVFYGERCLGVMVFGYAPTTGKKISKLINKIEKRQYIELQRTWISDELGHNTESWMMSRVMKSLKRAGVWIVLTHSGGCKDDVGFIFQASGWLYFGGESCNDFYLTEKGEYKNVVSALRFGRVPKEIIQRGNQSIGEYLFGGGSIICARRHLYVYPINRGVRHRLKKISLAYPKDPSVLRYNQEWVE